MSPPSVADLKTQAKRLRTALAAKGQTVSHSQALEILSVQHGYKDWNTACAALSKPNPLSFSVSDRVTGTYMLQPFEGEILSLSKLGSSGQYRITLQFDTPVDVVTFDSFSSFRSRVTCVITADGVAVKKTSNGEPYLRLKTSS